MKSTRAAAEDVAAIVRHDLAISLEEDRQAGNSNTIHKISACVGQYRLVALVCMSTDEHDGEELDRWANQTMLAMREMHRGKIIVHLPDSFDTEREDPQ